MNSPVLDVRGVGKRYATYASNFARFASWFGAPIRPISETWVLRDVGFVLGSGEALALIGQNGAGKSTLLKLITGTIRPSAGSIGICGRINAILELGLGFNPEMSGRQNIYQAGGLMGLSQDELSRLMPAIEEFAELSHYFDEPLRVYSSGMQARLAFALATAKRPELLIVDEVLSVGDSYFQHKSFDRIRQFKQEGTSILFVTHTMGDVRALCDRVILLDQGKVLKDGAPDEVVDFYNALIAQKENSKLTVEQRRNKDGWNYTRSGSFSVSAVKLDLLDAKSGQPVTAARIGQKLLLHLIAKADEDIPRLVLGYMLRDRTGHVVWGTNTWHTKQIVEDVKAGETVSYQLFFTCALGEGSYAVTPALTGSDNHADSNYEWQDNALVFDVVNVDRPYSAGTTALDFRFSVERIGA
ncbi:MAG: ABC transporter ATP-binding protein [Aquamicrobium sp.]|uniref:ABC transporter ATP-binding protein n=1 Tax=Aquamicrobium sp. TaxID=1872579 RepID=UPI00349E89BB|nr:ABC transporter ATP-binding protein [Aquamicrobium sp.]MCO5155860.1 ABC transporter ATP-binding protein [Aquamicrobium sp.]